MYAMKKDKERLPILHQCQNCELCFAAEDRAVACPKCLSTDRSNLIVLHMEEDAERAEWLELVDFSAGD